MRIVRFETGKWGVRKFSFEALIFEFQPWKYLDAGDVSDCFWWSGYHPSGESYVARHSQFETEADAEAAMRRLRERRRNDHPRVVLKRPAGDGRAA